MKPQTTLLALAAALMWIGAAGFAFVLEPDLHGDLLEIGVRPTVLGTTVMHFYFAGMAMAGFALMTSVAAVQSARGVAPPHVPLAIVAAIETVFGAMQFSRSHSPHHLGSIAMGILVAAALLMPSRQPLS
jgi:hypothetical protein